MLVLALGGCSSLGGKNCLVHDWYEQGRIDGSQGLDDSNLAYHLNRCPDQKDDKSVHQTYLNGWNAGLTQYCSPQNGFELGAAGRPYSKVCPSLLEKPFLAQYKQGQKLLELERENAQIESQLAKLTANREPASQNPTVRQQIRKLVAQRDANKKEINKIRSSAQLSL